VEQFQIREVVEKAIRITRPKWGAEAESRGVKIDIQADFKDTRPITGRLRELAKVFTHLIVNAIEAMSKGGKITVRTADTDTGVSAQVVDTGPGMDLKLQERCFRPFFSTKDGSAGVGLSISRGIVQQHGGRMGIVSEPGHGTTVFVELPLQSPAQSQRPEEPSPVAPTCLNRRLNILLVEDDAWTMDFLADNLKAEGHTVDTASNGLEGLEKYRQAKYDVVITDRAMPEMNGDELARVIKRIYPYEPVIMLTGFGEIMKGQGKIPPDVDAVVSKPVKMDVLTGAIADALLKTGQSISSSASS
jgi:CheY-like chemotaxis protein